MKTKNFRHHLTRRLSLQHVCSPPPLTTTTTTTTTNISSTAAAAAATEYGYERMPSARQLCRPGGGRRRSSMGHVPAPPKSSANSQHVVKVRKERRRSSLTHVPLTRGDSLSDLSASMTATCSPPRRRIRRLSSMSHLYEQNQYNNPYSCMGHESFTSLATTSALSAAASYYNSNSNNGTVAGPRQVLQLQASWQGMAADQRIELAEAILWQLVVVVEQQPSVADTTTTTTTSTRQPPRLGITSFRSPRIGILATLLVDTLDALVGHAGPDLWTESFAQWQSQWRAQGLSGSTVAQVLPTCLRECFGGGGGGGGDGSVLEGEKEEKDNTNHTTISPAKLQAWTCTIVPVLQQWE